MPPENSKIDEDTITKIQELSSSVIGSWGSDMFENLERSANTAGVFLSAIHSALLHSTPTPDHQRVQQIFRSTYFQILSGHLDEVEQNIAAESR